MLELWELGSGRQRSARCPECAPGSGRDPCVRMSSFQKKVEVGPHPLPSHYAKPSSRAQLQLTPALKGVEGLEDTAWGPGIRKRVNGKDTSGSNTKYVTSEQESISTAVGLLQTPQIKLNHVALEDKSGYLNKQTQNRRATYN